MSNIEHELEQIASEINDEPEVALPSLEEQKAIAAELKKLEEAGELTPYILEQYFGKFYSKTDKPVH
ncbi:restriction endonuclease subunit S [Vibrio sp.]|uniref:restriction endonuclease subunit S n=1 Tax=Vibrio sp. TaxID=678 RepID=UPI00311E7479